MSMSRSSLCNHSYKFVYRVSGFDREPAAMDAVQSEAMIECPYDVFFSLVAFYKLDEHKIACSHSPCSCIDSACDFIASSEGLLPHMKEAHGVIVTRAIYGSAFFCLIPTPPPTSTRGFTRLLCGNDSAVFGLTISALGQAVVVSLVCIRQDRCLWPRYTVKLCAPGPPGSMDLSMVESLNAVIELMSSSSPANISSDKLRTYLGVPPWFLMKDDADEGRRTKLQKIVICQVSTAAGGYKDFSPVAIFEFKIAVINGNDSHGWSVCVNEFQGYFRYCDAIIQHDRVFAVTENGCVYAWKSLELGLILILSPRDVLYLTHGFVEDDEENDPGRWWLARSAGGSRLLMVYTYGVSGNAIADDTSVVHYGRTVHTYPSGFECMVFSMDTSQLTAANRWKRVTDLGSYGELSDYHCSR